MQSRFLPALPDKHSPAGAEVRTLLASAAGGMIHSTVPPGQINRAAVHATVSEFWFILSGEGRIWRRDIGREDVTILTAGMSIDIPVGTAFQYRCDGREPLMFICITMPPWPGNDEATIIDGPWKPSAAFHAQDDAGRAIGEAVAKAGQP